MVTPLASALEGIGTWRSEAPPAPTTAVIVAPHPDDEVLGMGMIMSWLDRSGCPLTLLACTDGEGSHPRSGRITPIELAERRRGERARALDLLGVRPRVRRPSLPDGGLAGHIDELVEEITRHLDEHGTIVAPWLHDDHPDHRAAAQAAITAARTTGAFLWQIPIWGKVRGAEPYEGRVGHLELTRHARALKAQAVGSFESQLQPLGPGPHDGPVVTPAELVRILDGRETVIW